MSEQAGLLGLVFSYCADCPRTEGCPGTARGGNLRRESESPTMFGAPIAMAFAIQFAASLSPAPLPSAPSDLSLPSPTRLFERHSRAYGLLPLGSIRWSGTLTSGDTQAEYDVVADAAGHYRQDSKLPPPSHAEGDDGSVYWQQDENGNVTAVPATSHHGAVSRLLRLNDYKFDVSGSSVTGIVNVDGRQADAVHTQV